MRIGRRAAEGIVELAAEEEADLIIFGWGGKPARDRDGRRDRSSRRPSTRSCATRRATSRSSSSAARDVERILVPVRGGPHAELALRFADALGRYFDATVDVMHVVPAGHHRAVRAQAERALAASSGSTRRAARPLLVEGHNVGDAIMREAEEPQLVVMGASAPPGVAGATSPVRRAAETVAQQAKPTVDRGQDARADRPPTSSAAHAGRDAGGRRPRRRGVASIPARVDRWFAESNYHHAEFGDLAPAAQLKEKQGLTISAVLPTLNEAATIGPIVRRAEREMEEVPLDRRAARHRLRVEGRHARSPRPKGARVVRHTEVLPRYGTYRGKGEALWKSLYETTGDLVAWSDTDIRDWHPRFIYGTLGPLLVRAAAATSRPTTSARSWRAACSRRVAAGASPSSWRDR